MKRIEVDFAGQFENISHKASFTNKLKNNKNVKYHGVVSGIEKKNLLNNAHIFCLPSYYYIPEGQPVSILEAYASGCVVLTTNHGGIKDIFQTEVNGFEIEKRSSDSIMKILESIIINQSPLLDIALANRKLAENNFTKEVFSLSIAKLFDRITKFDKVDN